MCPFNKAIRSKFIQNKFTNRWTKYQCRNNGISHKIVNTDAEGINGTIKMDKLSKEKLILN